VHNTDAHNRGGQVIRGGKGTRPTSVNVKFKKKVKGINLGCVVKKKKKSRGEV